MKLFVSYAREDKQALDALVSRLPDLGHEVWIDSSLRGGEEWWATILHNIAESDAVIFGVTRRSLSSTACTRERDYAKKLGKPILPIALEHLSEAIPSELSTRHMVDYTYADQDAAFALVAALASLPAPPPLPDPLPEPPLVPLSYLSGLTDQISGSAPLSRQDQLRIMDELQRAARSGDDEERAGAQELLERLSARRGEDLLADVDDRITSLREELGSTPYAPAGSFAHPPRRGALKKSKLESTLVPPGAASSKKHRSRAVTILAIVGAIFIGLIVIGFLFASSSDGNCYWDVYGNYVCP